MTSHKCPHFKEAQKVKRTEAICEKSLPQRLTVKGLTSLLMHRILSSPEILNRIFSYSTGQTIITTARVCQIWFTHSIRFIWDTVDLNDVMRLLSSFDDHGFQRTLNSKSWDRFFLYSKYVRYLECPKVNFVALRQMLPSQPSTTPIFPILTRLTWIGVDEQIECLFPFLTSTVQALDISLGVIQRRWTADALCKAIAKRSPYLRVFVLEFKTPPTVENHMAITSALGELMSRLSQLILLFIPIRFMTPELLRIILQLSNLEILKIFRWTFNRWDYTSDIEEALKRKITVDDGKTGKFLPFYSLRDFYIIDEPCFRISHVLERAIQLPKLVHLTCSPYGKPNEAIATMESIHITCPNLQMIKIESNSNKPLSTRLPWQAIERLLHCPYLHTLIVCRQIDMDLDNLITVATNRPSWEVVSLPSVKALGYEALVPFAQNCPHLVELGLTLGKDEDLPVLGTFEGAQFPSLTTLNVGRSAITFPIQVAKFLTSLCGNTLEIKASTDKFTPSWRIVEEIINVIIREDPAEYYKEIPLAENSN